MLLVRRSDEFQKELIMVWGLIVRFKSKGRTYRTELKLDYVVDTRVLERRREKTKHH